VVDIGALLDDAGVGGVELVVLAERSLGLGDAPQIVDLDTGDLIRITGGEIEQGLPRLGLLERLELGPHLVLAQQRHQFLGHLPVRGLVLQPRDRGAHADVARVVELPQRLLVDPARRGEQVGGRLPARVRRPQPRDLRRDARPVAAAGVVAQRAVVDAGGVDRSAVGTRSQADLDALLQRLREAWPGGRISALRVRERRRQEEAGSQHGQQANGQAEGTAHVENLSA
jgi:hypothetical protein